MADSSGDSSDRRRQRSPSPAPRQHVSKLFVTNLDGRADIKELQDDLRRMFEKCGEVESVVAKRNRNSEYCFAFVEMKEQTAAQDCVKEYDQNPLNGKPIKVEFQDDTKRRKDANKGCYNCGKMGHFARQCHSSRPSDRDRGYYSRRYSRSRSRSESEDRRKKKRKHRSYSSDRGRSRSPKSKKDRKRKSRDREEKHKKKHRRRDSSDS